MQPTLPGGRHILLTLDHHPNHIPHLLQPAQHNLIPLHKPIAMIRNPRLLTKLPHQLLAPPKIMPRHAGKQVVHGLKLQTAVDPVQPRGAIHVHGCAHLALGEGLGGAEVGGRHAPMRECDLYVQDHGDQVADEDEADADGPAGQRAPDEQVAEDEPVAPHEDDFHGARPPRGA